MRKNKKRKLKIQAIFNFFLVMLKETITFLFAVMIGIINLVSSLSE